VVVLIPDNGLVGTAAVLFGHERLRHLGSRRSDRRIKDVAAQQNLAQAWRIVPSEPHVTRRRRGGLSPTEW